MNTIIEKIRIFIHHLQLIKSKYGMKPKSFSHTCEAEDEPQEEPVVPLSDAVAGPRAVVVESAHAVAAHFAMRAARRTIYATGLTEFASQDKRRPRRGAGSRAGERTRAGVGVRIGVRIADPDASGGRLQAEFAEMRLSLTVILTLIAKILLLLRIKV